MNTRRSRPSSSIPTGNAAPWNPALRSARRNAWIEPASGLAGRSTVRTDANDLSGVCYSAIEIVLLHTATMPEDERCRPSGGRLESLHPSGQALLDVGAHCRHRLTSRSRCANICSISTWTEDPTSEGEAAESDPWALLRIPVVDPAGWSISTVDAGLRLLDRLRSELEGATALLVAARSDDRDSTAALSRLSRISNREARKRRAVAAVVAGLPGALDLLRRAELTVEHLAVLRPVVDTPGAARLLDAGVGMSPEEFGRSVQQ